MANKERGLLFILVSISWWCVAIMLVVPWSKNENSDLFSFFEGESRIMVSCVLSVHMKLYYNVGGEL